MKKLFLSATIALAAAMPVFGKAPASTADSSTVYGVAFYNLENLFDTINANGKFDLEFSPLGARKWNSEKYNLKLNNLANAIAGMVSPLTPGGPAVIGIAEVENESVVADLVAAKPIAGRGLKYVHHDSPDARGIDVALLYDPGLFEVTGVEAHRLYVESNPTFLTRDQLCVSGVLGIDTISVIVNHWPSRLGGQEQSEYLRVAAAELSKSIADSIRKVSPLRPIIIMGDLNDDPQNTSCAMTLGARKEAYDVPPTGFYNPWWNILESGKGTLTYRGKWNLFDQIIVGGMLLPDNGATLTLVGAEICDLDFLKQTQAPYTGMPHRTYAGGRFLNGYSDHFPTQIFLKRK